MAAEFSNIRKFTKKQYMKAADSGFDFNLLIVLIFLISFGLIMVYSASSYVAVRDYGDQAYFFKKQLLWDVLGLAFMILIIFVGPKILTKLKNLKWIYFLVGNIVPFLIFPFGIESHGATRWVKLGPVSFQPAEVTKIMMILFMASWLISLKDKINTWIGFGFSILFMLIPVLIVYKITDNLSSAIIIALICTAMIFVASDDYKKWIIFVLIVAAIVGGVILYVEKSGISGDTGFRLARIYTWLHPGSSADTTAHQTIQGLYAIGNGGIWGKGLGQSVQKISTLPEPQNDMIFAIVCEELGFVGALALITMYAILIYRMYSVAMATKNKFGFMTVIGVMTHISVQAILNIAVATNSMPNTGVSLPFISYGGSSAVMLLGEMGLVFAVNRFNIKEERA